MKYLYIIIILLLVSGSVATAQHSVKTDYFINTSQTRSYLNPAFRPAYGYIGIPFLSNVYVDIKTNTLNLDHLTFKKEGYSKILTFMHPDVAASEFLNNMKRNNYLAADVSYKIITAGFYTGTQFWTIDLGVRAHAEVNIPKNVFTLLKEGFSSDITSNSDPIKYDLKNIGGSASTFGELGIGYSRPLLKNSLNIGARAKFLVGFGNFDAEIERLDVEYGYDEWKFRSKANISGSFMGIKTKENDNGDFDGIEVGGLGVVGWGLGFDVGAVYDFKNLSDDINTYFLYYILSRTKVSMAFTDIGFISWSGSNTVHMVSRDMETSINFNELNLSDESRLNEQLESILDDVRDAFNFRESDANKGKNTFLRTNVNIGLEYEAWKDNMTVGLLSSTQFGKLQMVTEFTVSANFNPAKAKWIATSLSYSFIHSRFDTFGLALHLAPRKGVNFFIASDYVIPHVNREYIPTTSKALNIQFGLSVPLGGKKMNRSCYNKLE